MGSDPVTVVANSLYRHDQSIDLGNYDSGTALQETRICGIVIILMALSKATTNFAFPWTCGVVWCGVTGDQLVCPYISLQRQTGDIYANVLQDELPAFIKNVPLQKRRQMYYQDDGAPSHFSQVVRQYLNHNFPNRWIGRGGTKNWPPRSPDLNPLDYNVWGYMEVMVYAHKVNTTEELF